MAMSQNRYVLITSGVGGAAAAANRELIARLMTTNTLAPTLGILEFGGGASTALKNVGTYFGTTSDEYKFASKYFSFISKDIKQADKISFARYTPSATAPMLISTTHSALSSFTSISDGSIKISMGGVATELTGINLTSATSLADVASLIQTGVRTYTAGGTLWTSATVSYTNNNFTLTGGETGSATISAATEATTGTDLTGLLGWGVANSPIISSGCDAETLTEALDRISNTSNNFGSFSFIKDLTTDEVIEVGTWTNVQNVMYMFSYAVSPSTYSEVQAGVAGMNGVCLTLDKYADFAEYMPMVIGACIDYTRVNASTNFMFQSFDSDTPSVSTDTEADTYDAVKVNYLGSTQQAGKTISFYQRGVLQGDISDIGVYYNEMWLKDSFMTEFLNILLALRQVPANANGANICRGVMNYVIELAKTNGVVSIGKTLTNTQKAYITSISGDDNAWREVETNGCWLSLSIKEQQNNGITEYIVDYIFIYAKGDSIKKVVGSDILI